MFSATLYPHVLFHMVKDIQCGNTMQRYNALILLSQRPKHGQCFVSWLFLSPIASSSLSLLLTS